METICVGRSLGSFPVVSFTAHRRFAAATAVPQSRRFQGVTSFTGKQLRKQSTSNYVLRRQTKTFVITAHQDPGLTTPITGPLGAEHVLDDFSRFLYRKIGKALSPYFPEGFDVFDWLPENIHEKLHGKEKAATLLVREILHFSLFYFLFTKVDNICRWLNWLYMINTKRSKNISDDQYEGSSFRAMSSPLRFLIVVWAATRLAHIIAPILKLTVEFGVTAKMRSIGLILAVTWFFLKWKALYVNHLAAASKMDAPRIFAFDKVVSLLMYFVAASCIGEVTGFALRSLLAVGGFSGVALGLAAKEIVSNFFGGAVLFITRPFVIGERIKAGNFSGYVQDIGFLQTKILSGERVPMIVPNQNFINQVITNYSRAKNKLMEAEFPARIQDIFLADRITSRVVQYLRTQPDVDSTKSSPVCYLKSLNSSGMIIAVNCILRPSGGSEFYRAQQAVLIDVAEIILSEGASIGGYMSLGPPVSVGNTTPGIAGILGKS